MGQFKPMVKMMTTEPSVILKLKKGGKVASKMDGGYMPMQSTMPSQMPATGGAPMGMAPKRPSMMARRRAMNPNLLMKKGGVTAAEVEKELKQHESKSMSKAHKKAMGGKIDSAETKTTVKGNAGKYLNTKVVDGDKTDKAHGTKGVKSGNAGGYANGGTIKGNAGKYLNTKVVDGDKTDKASGTGGVKMGNAGGFKMGGKVNWENRPADTAKPGKSNTTTGGVKNANGGGYKMGGSAKKAYATGGTVDSGKPVAMPKKPMSRPVANSMQSGTFAKGGKVNFYSDLAKKLEKNPEKPNLRLIKTHTGPKGHVAKVYKDRDYGEYRTKFYSPEGKHLTEGDSHTDDSEDAHMTAKHEVNRGYAKGGKAKKYADGSSVKPVDDAKTVSDKASRELEEALNPLGMIKEGYGKIRDYFTSKPAGSVTKTEKSVTVAPRKRGGSAMC
jgi:hypothetical protein